MKAPELFYIDHPLANVFSLSDPVCATFTDEQLEEYRKLYEEYLAVQRKAAAEGLNLTSQLRELVDILFQEKGYGYDRCKQRKYFDRMIKTGQTVIDLHAQKYPAPNKVRQKVLNAREIHKVCEDSRLSVGDDTLQEINNAITFLIGKGLVLNTDFTVSNAVEVAKSIVRAEIQKCPEDTSFPIDDYNLCIGDVYASGKDFSCIRSESSWRGRYVYTPKTDAVVPSGLDHAELIADPPSSNELDVSFENCSIPAILLKGK